MATSTNCSFNSSIQRYQLPNLRNQNQNQKQKQQQQSVRVKCALVHQEKRESRRLVSISFVFFLHCLSIPQHAIAGNVLDKYVKSLYPCAVQSLESGQDDRIRKKLDPLEAYVPAVILTQLQIEDLGKTLELDQPQYVSCRNLLRSGPAASLRINIRAVAQYASDSGNGKTAFQNVDQCLRALEELDSLLLHASRNDGDASVETMKAKIVIAVDSLDSLLKTVPSDVLDKGKAIANAYRVPEEDIAPEKLDPELKQLESIL